MKFMINDYWRLMRFDKPIGILLLLWPTLWALWLAARGAPSLPILLIFLIGVVLMRAAGCVINDIADRRIDGQVQRTAKRPLATQAIQPQNALILFGILCLIAGSLVWFLNRLTLYLAVAALALACLYPFTKRFTHWPQAFLGLAFAWGIPMAFAAQLNQVPLLAWWLFATTLVWIMVYDTFYAMTDREDDLKIGVKSTAVLFGQYDRLILGGMQIAVLISLALIGWRCQLNRLFYLFWFGALLLAGYQQYLIRRRESKACFRAFLNNHWFGCLIFLGIWLGMG
jgi:4-hydroxybenzoate polyprenyltransferase